MLATGPVVATAQDTSPEPAPLPAPPEMPPEKVEPGPPIGAPAQGQDLSDQLSRSGGVIKPAPNGGDPEIVQPPPDAGTARTPVIPPPGTPENQPNVQPK
jgi:hypothetical protein